MTDAEFLRASGWRAGWTVGLMHDESRWAHPRYSAPPLTTEQAVKAQIEVEAERLSFVLARCEVSLSVPDPHVEGRAFQTGTTYTGTLTLKVKP